MEELNDFPVQVRIPIAWGEMDAFEHVNNVYYYRYFETARAQYFLEIGLFAMKSATGIGPILAQTSCRYIQPLTYPDQIVVGAKVKSIGNSSFVMEYLIVSDKVGVAASGEGVLVVYDFNKSAKTEVPSTIREAIRKIEKKNGEGDDDGD